MVISSSVMAALISPKAVSGLGEGGEERTWSANVPSEGIRLTVSQAARDLARAASATEMTDSSQAIQARVAQIQSKDALSRTEEEMGFLLTHDRRLAEITAKGFEQLSADEVEYEQQARGLVNTMSQFSAEERALFDELRGPEHKAAREGLAQIAFTRAVFGHMAGGENGTTYDPRSTPITADNILTLFSHSMVDSTGLAQRQLLALAEYLQHRPA